jgi:hypothetical protein
MEFSKTMEPSSLTDLVDEEALLSDMSSHVWKEAVDSIESVFSMDCVDSIVPIEEESFKRFLSYFVEKSSGRRFIASIALSVFLKDSIELS